MKTLRIATRKSPLALWQANYVKQQLEAIHKNLSVELLTMVTQGDVILDSPLSKIGGKGLFVKELEQALLDGRADIAVHSMKDVPVAFPDNLGLSVICEREDPRDAWVSHHYVDLDSLPHGATVGTCSLRRQAQLLARRPDIQIKELRGNVGTRLKKLDDGHYDAIVLAAAGLKRLELHDRIRSYLSVEESLPAVGQGAVGIECRLNDIATIELLKPLHHPNTGDCVMAERAMNLSLEGGCQVPIGCYAILEGNDIWLRGLVAETNGQRVIRDEIRGPREQAHDLGVKLAQQLLTHGARDILKALYNQ